MTNIRLRESQERILAYEGGLMGISAVPGSGKTFTLSHLAAKLVLESDLAFDQEVLIVTFSNVAADNFSARIGKILSSKGIMEGIGYKVRTLHGLASDIIRERPDLAGLSNDFSIIDESESTEILKELVQYQMLQEPEIFDSFVSESFRIKNNPRKVETELRDEIYHVVSRFIKTAKDHLLSADQVQTLIDNAETPSSLLLICQKIYQAYQAALNYRGALDFDDLIRLAWMSLHNDEELLKSLQYRWPYILEDEAQDSSLVQEAILTLLTSKEKNWVRVGDPNQAINESFTNADPRLLREFIKRADVQREELPESGRSCPQIISLANTLNEWSQYYHPNPIIRDALSHPLIERTKPGDPQQNPECNSPAIDLQNKRFSSDLEIDFLIADIKQWLEEHPDDTLAVLAPINKRVAKLADDFDKARIPVVQALMRNPENTRISAGAIYRLLRSLQEPSDPTLLSSAFKVLFRQYQDDEKVWLVVEKCVRYIKMQKAVETLLYNESPEFLVEFEDMYEEELANDFMNHFIHTMRRWHKATVLPLDQTIITIAQDLALDPVELATIHKISQLVKQILNNQPEWNINEVINELKEIAKNNRAFFSFNDAEDGFDPDLHKGKVVVATYHKAKGLEWDKVYLSSLNNFDFPSALPEDYFISERQIFVEPRNRQAEIRAELLSLIDPTQPAYVPGVATMIDRNDVARERIRLLYVGITRAKKSLTGSFNTGRYGNQSEALAIKEIRERWQDET
jgi:DNA helicase-2/ATP-dependent DNA helicase PcrA